MDAVHHLTYERMGAELLEDLMAICDPCHEFLSGKSEDDPLTAGVRVYLAGKITDNEWRKSLMVLDNKGRLEGDRFTCPANFIAHDDRDHWPVARRALRGGFDFTGPWFIDTFGGHGGKLNAGTHGRETDRHGQPDETNRPGVTSRCRLSLATSQIVFAWIDRPDAYGTIWELGFARGCCELINHSGNACGRPLVR